LVQRVFQVLKLTVQIPFFFPDNIFQIALLLG
jgi:hypothetical protein